jgi:hypothetical protein
MATSAKCALTPQDIDLRTIELVRRQGEGGMCAVEVNAAFHSLEVPYNASERMQRLESAGQLKSDGYMATAPLKKLLGSEEPANAINVKRYRSVG